MQLSLKVWPRGWTPLSRSKLLISVLILSLIVAVGYRIMFNRKLVEVKRTFPVLGTFATIIVVTESDKSQHAFSKAESLLIYLDTELGRFSETGALFTLNNQFSIATETELGQLILLSDSIVTITNNYFDPSLGALSDLWGFPEKNVVPDSTAVIQTLLNTGWQTMVHINSDSITIEPGAQLDFGAIAKGYAVDRTYELLMEMGATECLVEVGGEVRCGSLTGRQWYIGVRHPRDDNLAGIIEITSGAVATSGDYECFFIENGVRYSHLLDSRTGYPSEKSASATVIAESCATADAIATAAAVAGPSVAGQFSSEYFSGMIVIIADQQNRCETFEFGDIPWAE